MDGGKTMVFCLQYFQGGRYIQFKFEVDYHQRLRVPNKLKITVEIDKINRMSVYDYHKVKPNTEVYSKLYFLRWYFIGGDFFKIDFGFMSVPEQFHERSILWLIIIITRQRHIIMTHGSHFFVNNSCPFPLWISSHLNIHCYNCHNKNRKKSRKGIV